MKRWGITTSALVLALVAAVTTVTAVPATAMTPTLLSQAQVKKALLTLPQVDALVGLTDLKSDELACHHAPYYKGVVNYCYYVSLRSDAAFRANTAWPNHVDIISFVSTAAAQRYINELKRDRTTSVLLGQTAASATFYDKDAPIYAPAAGAGTAANLTGPTVSAFWRKGLNVVYTACADPKATTNTSLAACATKVAKAQLLRLP
jgi:hypothetical protein